MECPGSWHLVLGLLAGLALPAPAQTVHFNGIQTTLNTPALQDPAGMAVDAYGDVYIADANNHRVLVVPPGGSASAGTVGVGLQQPVSVALDPAGNVYIGDAGLQETCTSPTMVWSRPSGSIAESWISARCRWGRPAPRWP